MKLPAEMTRHDQITGRFVFTCMTQRSVQISRKIDGISEALSKRSQNEKLVVNVRDHDADRADLALTTAAEPGLKLDHLLSDPPDIVVLGCASRQFGFIPRRIVDGRPAGLRP